MLVVHSRTQGLTWVNKNKQTNKKQAKQQQQQTNRKTHQNPLPEVIRKQPLQRRKGPLGTYTHLHVFSTSKFF